jgi:hypothetical protein
VRTSTAQVVFPLLELELVDGNRAGPGGIDKFRSRYTTRYALTSP